MTEKQRTIRDIVQIEGTGLHTAQCGTITFRPAEANHGIKFRRIDLESQPIIDAVVENVVDTSRGTTIGINGAKVYTIEHILASLRGLGIDNVLIDIDVEETPIKDGSAKCFVEVLEKAGIVEQDIDREYIVIDKPIHFKNEEKGFEMKIEPCDTFKIDVKIDYGTNVLNVQEAHLYDINDFKSEIAPCRTFVFLHELEFLLKNNLIKGGDLDNAIIFIERQVTQQEMDHLARLFNKPTMKVKDEGILNNLDLHFSNEPARHKLLDVVGDLTLLGKPIKGHVTTYKPGHYANTEFARLIRKNIQ